MQITAGMDPRIHPRDVGAYAHRVESLGFDSLNVTEMQRDPFISSASALSATTGLNVKTGVALAFVRSPMATALAAWDLALLSTGRFDLGLGSQVRANIENRYGMPFDRPVARLAEHVAAIEASFESFESGEGMSFQGEFHSLTRLQPEFRPSPLGEVRRPDIWLGAVGDQLVELAGRRAAGLITHPTSSHPVDLRSRILPALQRGASEVDRTAPPVIVCPMVATGPTVEDVAQATTDLLPQLAFLYSTPQYWPTLEKLGHGELGPRLRQLTREDRWDDLTSVLTKDAVDVLILAETYTDLPDAVRDWYGSGVSGVIVRPPADPAHDDDFGVVIDDIRSI